MARSWYRMTAAQGAAELFIYDEIGMFGVTAAMFIRDLQALGDVSEIRLHIASIGGDVYNGLAIYNALSRHPAKVTVQIDGLAASMASYIAMVGDRIEMPANTFLMIHDPSAWAGGRAEELKNVAEHLEQVTQTLAEGYAAKSGKSVEEMRRIMAATTFYSAAEAVENGFADAVIEAVEIAACAFRDSLQNLNLPSQVAAAIARPSAAPPTDEEETEMSGTKPADGQNPANPNAADTAQETQRASAIADLCAKNGVPEMAATFIADGTSLEAAKSAVEAKGALRQVCDQAAGLMGSGTSADTLFQEFTAKGVNADAARAALWDRMAETSKANEVVTALTPAAAAAAAPQQPWAPVVQSMKK